MRRRQRGAVLLSALVTALVMFLILGVAARHYLVAQRAVRRHEDADAALHAARGAVRWAEGMPGRSGTFQRPHELGTITVTVATETISAECRGRRVVLDRKSSAWSEE